MRMQAALYKKKEQVPRKARSWAVLGSISQDDNRNARDGGPQLDHHRLQAGPSSSQINSVPLLMFKLMFSYHCCPCVYISRQFCGRDQEALTVHKLSKHAFLCWEDAPCTLCAPMPVRTLSFVSRGWRSSKYLPEIHSIQPTP